MTYILWYLTVKLMTFAQLSNRLQVSQKPAARFTVDAFSLTHWIVGKNVQETPIFFMAKWRFPWGYPPVIIHGWEFPWNSPSVGVFSCLWKPLHFMANSLRFSQKITIPSGVGHLTIHWGCGSFRPRKEASPKTPGRSSGFPAKNGLLGIFREIDRLCNLNKAYPILPGN